MVTPYTPELKWSAGLQYEFDTGSLGHVHRPRRMSSSRTTSTPRAQPPTSLIESYTLTNARLAGAPRRDLWETAVEVTDVTDELYYPEPVPRPVRRGRPTWRQRNERRRDRPATHVRLYVDTQLLIGVTLSIGAAGGPDNPARRGGVSRPTARSRRRRSTRSTSARPMTSTLPMAARYGWRSITPTPRRCSTTP